MCFVITSNTRKYCYNVVLLFHCFLAIIVSYVEFTFNKIVVIVLTVKRIFKISNQIKYKSQLVLNVDSQNQAKNIPFFLPSFQIKI